MYAFVDFFSFVDGGQNDSSEGGFSSSKSQAAKKRRKSRTAFTNKQIYELEKRFLYQKYLTPVDRDEIALSLGLTNAQVITWFQNRRAKLKRDMEELKADVTAAKALGTTEPPAISTPSAAADVLKVSKGLPGPGRRKGSIPISPHGGATVAVVTSRPPTDDDVILDSRREEETSSELTNKALDKFKDGD